MHPIVGAVAAEGWMASPQALPELRFRDDAAASPDRGRSLVWTAAGLTVLVHIGFWALLGSRPYRDPPAGAPPLEVVFITADAPRALPVPPMPQPPPRAATRATATPASRPLHSPAVPDSVPPAPLPTRALQLFDQDSRLRLPEAEASIDSYIAPESRAQDLRTLGSRPRLPGSDQPVVDIGKLPPERSPAQIVGLIGQYLFGASQPDSCDKVERRLIDETDPLAKQITMDTFNKRCRGWR